jgi:hypothetical protein
MVQAKAMRVCARIQRVYKEYPSSAMTAVRLPTWQGALLRARKETAGRGHGQEHIAA